MEVKPFIVLITRICIRKYFTTV